LKLDQPELLSSVQEELDAIIAADYQMSLEFVEPKEGEPGMEGGCQRRWCWADALFMAPPAWALMTQATGDEKYLDYAVKETKATTDYLFDKDIGLFFRDSRYFDQRTENGKYVFWSRGNGWVFAGLARFIEQLPTDHPDRDYFIDVFRIMAETLIARQRPDGYWPTSLDDPDAFISPETSGTGFFGFGLTWGLNNGVLEGVRFRDAADSAWNAMTAAVDDPGKLGWVQQIGADPQKTNKDSTQLYAVGAFLLLAAERIELENAAE
jgi:rhamnogalacturonyl hydrolase YesR